MQLPTPTPQFVFCQYATIKEPYKRYLENKIRDNWDSQVFQLIFILEIGKNPDASRDFCYNLVLAFRGVMVLFKYFTSFHQIPHLQILQTASKTTT
jgi:hypothetical protein